MPERLDTLTSYLPRRLIDRLVLRGGLPAAPTADSFEGAALFADLSGFTVLAERLAREGADGAERLTRVLETCFSDIIARVLGSGGDVMTFAGDAVLAVWPTGPDQSLQTAARAAVRCAQECHEALRRNPANPDGALKLRIGVGVGECTLHELGGVEDLWTAVVSGSALRRMGRAEKAAAPGETAVADELLPMLGPETTPEQAGVGWRVPAATELPVPEPPVASSRWPDAAKEDPALERALRAFVPGAVQVRLDAGQTAWLAELRTVSAVFVQLHHLDPSQAESAVVLQRVITALQRCLRRWEGSLNKLVVDDRGTTIVIGFGFPPYAHEDDAVRAVRTASLCRDICRGEDLAFGIGVTTGRAFCGAYGSALRREYTMLGDSVNLAARLMQAAPNDVWVDVATLREAVGRIAFAELPAVRVKGKAELVPVATPIGELDATGRHEVLLTGRHEAILTGRLDVTQTGSLERPVADLGASGGDLPRISSSSPTLGPRMLGREREYERLTRLLDALPARGPSAVAVVVAEAGMGKSLLAATLHAEAAQRGLLTALGAADPSSTAEPFQAFRDVLAALLGLPASRTHAETRAAVEVALEGEPTLRTWAPLLEPAIPAGWEDNAITARMTGAPRSDGLRQLLLFLLARATAQAPRLVVLDDAQWLDASSWALLLAASQRVAGLLVLVLTRGAPTESAASRELWEHPATERLELGPVPDAALHLLVARCVGVAELPPGIGDAIARRAEGNPYFAEELAWALLDSGQLVVRGGAAALRPGSRPGDLLLPDTLQSAVTARLDRLAPAEALTAKVASVIGRQFSWRVLHDVHPVAQDRGRLRELLDALGGQGVLSETADAQDPAFSFRHGLVQETAYSLLPFEQRRKLHRAIAAWLEANHAEDGGRLATIGLHWRRADELGRAIEAFEEAGRTAVRRGANQEAVVLLDDALRIAEEQDARGEISATPLRRGRWRFGQGEAFMQAGEMPHAKERFGLALALLGVALPRSAAGWTLRLLRELLQQLRLRLIGGRAGPPERHEAERLALVARTASMYGGICYFTIEPLQWLAASLLAANQGERAGDDASAAQALGSIGLIAGTLRLQSAARDYFARGQSAEEIRDKTVVDWTEAVFELTYCRWELLDPVLRRGVVLGRSVSDAYTLGVGLTVEAIAAWLRGRPSDAILLHDEVLASSRERGNIEHLSWSLTFGVPARLELGRTDEVVAQLEEVRGLLGRVDPFTRVVYEGVRAELLSRLGRHEEALSAVVEMIARYKDHGTVLYTYLPALGGAGEALIAAALAERDGVRRVAADGQGWRALGRQLQRIFASAALLYVYFRPRRHLVRGSLFAARGRPRSARAAWARAEESARRLGLPGEVGRVAAERVRFGHDG